MHFIVFSIRVRRFLLVISHWRRLATSSGNRPGKPAGRFEPEKATKRRFGKQFARRNLRLAIVEAPAGTIASHDVPLLVGPAGCGT